MACGTGLTPGGRKKEMRFVGQWFKQLQKEGVEVGGGGWGEETGGVGGGGDGGEDTACLTQFVVWLEKQTQTPALQRRKHVSSDACCCHAQSGNGGS